MKPSSGLRTGNKSASTKRGGTDNIESPQAIFGLVDARREPLELLFVKVKKIDFHMGPQRTRERKTTEATI